jgi:hypothetical protein
MFRGLSFSLLAAAVALGAADRGFAQTSMAGSASQHAFINLGEPSIARSVALNGLAQKAAALGQVRVIVGLRSAVRPDNELTALQSAAQTQRLLVDQTAVALRAGVAPASVVTFDYIPFV